MVTLNKYIYAASNKSLNSQSILHRKKMPVRPLKSRATLRPARKNITSGQVTSRAKRSFVPGQEYLRQINLRFQNSNVWEIAIFLSIVKSVANNKFIWTMKSEVVNIKWDLVFDIFAKKNSS